MNKYAFLVILFLLASCSKPGNQPKAIFRGGLERHGVFYTKSLDKLKGLKWRFKTGGQVKSSPAIEDGVLYVGSNDGFFYAIDIETGSQLWRINTGGEIASSPVVHEGIVYVGSVDCNLYGFDAKTGKENFRFSAVSEIYSSPIIYNNTIYFGTLDKSMVQGSRMYAVDLSTESEKWSIDIVRGYYSGLAPSISNESLYFCWFGLNNNNGQMKTVGKGGVTAVNIEYGDELWTYELEGLAGYSIIDKKRLYFSKFKTITPKVMHGELVALNKTNGEEEWSFLTNSEISSSVYFDKVLLNFSGSKMYALDSETGKEKWNFSLSGEVSSAPSFCDGIVYFGSKDTNIYALDAQTGKEIWHFKTGGAINSAPVISDGKVFFGSDDQYIYALE